MNIICHYTTPSDWNSGRKPTIGTMKVEANKKVIITLSPEDLGVIANLTLSPEQARQFAAELADSANKLDSQPHQLGTNVPSSSSRLRIARKQIYDLLSKTRLPTKEIDELCDCIMDDFCKHMNVKEYRYNPPKFVVIQGNDSFGFRGYQVMQYDGLFARHIVGWSSAKNVIEAIANKFRQMYSEEQEKEE